MRIRQIRYYSTDLLFVAFSIVLTLCSGQPVAINYGVDKCVWCDKIIDDNHFGSTLVAQDGKVFKFNSIECLMAFHIQPTIPNESFQASWVCDYNNPGHLVRAGQASYVHTDTKASPNGLGLFAFSSDEDAITFAAANRGQTIEWDGVKKVLKETWFKPAPDLMNADSLQMESTGS